MRHANPEQAAQLVQSQDYTPIMAAANFAEQSMKVYDELLVGETDAKVMYLALLVMGGTNGMGGVLLGPPGTGKSRLLKYGEKVVGGIEDDQVAFVPHKADLTSAKLVGEESEMERLHITEEGESTDRFKATLKPILHRGVKAVKFDEVNRTSPLALNAALDILQEGGVKVFENGKPIELTEFDLVISSMNHYGTIFTNRLDPALLNRFAMGSFMGSREDGKLSKAGESIWDKDEDHESRPEINPVIELAGLHQIRDGIKDIFIDAPERKAGKRMTVGMLEEFSEQGIESGDPRISAQIKKVARTLALLHGSSKVTHGGLRTAFKYAMTARLGADGERTPEQIDKHIDKAFTKAV